MRLLRGVLPPIIVFVLAAVVTELIVRGLDIPAFTFPAPSAVLAALFNRRGDLAMSLLNTAEASLIGFACSAFIGIGLAIVLSTSRLIERAFYPYTIFFQTVPIVAIAPLLVIWFGFGLKSVAVSAFIASVFPVVATTLAGLLSTDPALRDLFRLYGASRWATLWKLTLPSALPSIFTGLRVAAGLAVIGAIVGEFVAGVLNRGAGLGITILVAKRPSDTAYMFAAVLVASLLGLTMLAAIRLCGYFALRRWHVSEQNT